MSRIRMILLSSLAAFAVSAAAVTAAQAIQGPYYKVEGARLKATESKEIINAKAGAAGFLLKSTTGVEIHCEKISITGQVIGSNTTNGSGSKETISFTECTQKGNGPATCKVEAGTVKTNPLSNRLAYSSAMPATGQKLLVVFEPEEGTLFAEIKFTGTGCTATSIGVEPSNAGGGVCGEAWSGGAAVKINEANEIERKVGEINFPTPAIAKAWVEDSAALTEVKCGLVITGGTAATLTGLSSFELNGKPNWGVFTKGPKVKVEPKTLAFKELNKLEKEELTLTYTNEGPGGWQPTEFIFTKLEGELGAWGVKLGGIPCNKVIAVGKTCEEIVTFEPKVAAAGKIKADLTTNPASETAVVEGKGK